MIGSGLGLQLICMVRCLGFWNFQICSFPSLVRPTSWLSSRKEFWLQSQLFWSSEHISPQDSFLKTLLLESSPSSLLTLASMTGPSLLSKMLYCDTSHFGEISQIWGLMSACGPGWVITAAYWEWRGSYSARHTGWDNLYSCRGWRLKYWEFTCQWCSVFSLLLRISSRFKWFTSLLTLRFFMLQSLTCLSRLAVRKNVSSSGDQSRQVVLLECAGRVGLRCYRSYMYQKIKLC